VRTLCDKGSDKMKIRIVGVSTATLVPGLSPSSSPHRRDHANQRTRISRICCVVVASLLVPSSRAHADPVILSPTSFAEIVDDRIVLRQETAQNVALGPGAETRVFYQFVLAPLRSMPPSAVLFSATRGFDVFSECALLIPCPDLTRVNIYGYPGNGSITLADYDAGTLLGSVTAIPDRGGAINLDVTAFISGLLSGHGDFAGVVLRPGSFGALEFSSAQLSATPEPGSLTLLTIAGLAAIARRRRRCR
jgi:hypothetical protein